MVIINLALAVFGAGIYRCYSTSTQNLCKKVPCNVGVHMNDLYSKCYSAKDLVQKFLRKTCENDNLRKNAKGVSSSEAVQSLRQTNRLGEKPTKFHLCTALSSCAKTLNWHLGIQIHAYIIHSGYDDNLFLSSALVDFYAKCGSILEARKVFDGMKIHDQVSWTSLIAGFSLNEQGRDAFLMFKDMLGTHIKPTCHTYASVISACVEQKEALVLCSTLHAQVMKRGCDTNNCVVSSLICCYAKGGEIDDAVSLFDMASEKDIVLCNSMISGYSQNLCYDDALKLFLEMRKKNLSPTDRTLTSILSACASVTVLFPGVQLHSLVIKMGLENNMFVVSALIDMYSKVGDIEGACSVLDQTSEKNSVLWTSMISGYAQSGRGSDALELFDHLLNEERFVPDHVCFIAVLTACNHAGLLDKGEEYFNKMRKDYGLCPDLDHYACLVDLYARCGKLRKARDLMEEMPYDPNSVMWSSFLGFCKIHGEVELGREAADQLMKMEPCNAAHYITLAHLYTGNGLWNEAAEVRKVMQHRKIIKRAGWSWIEVDKQVHVFAVGDTSHHQSDEIYAELEKVYLEMRQASFI